MAWIDTVTATQLTTVDDVTEEFFDLLPELNPGEEHHVTLTLDNESGSVANGIIISVYTTLDRDPSPVWDDVPYHQFEHVPDGIAAEQLSLVVSGIFRYRIGLLAAGATDDYTADMKLRSNGVNLG